MATSFKIKAVTELRAAKKMAELNKKFEKEAQNG